jgi:hypothetical protein
MTTQADISRAPVQRNWEDAELITSGFLCAEDEWPQDAPPLPDDEEWEDYEEMLAAPPVSVLTCGECGSEREAGQPCRVCGERAEE